MKKVAIVGHFCLNHECIDGQTVKTNTLSSAFEKYTDVEVTCVDTHGWSHHPIELYLQIKAAFKKCDCVIMLPAHKGVRVFAPLLCHFKKRYGKKIYYDVIGGWLAELLKNNKGLCQRLKFFDGIFVETDTMKNELCKMEFDNISVIPNFKDIVPMRETELVYDTSLPYKLCTFSRVAHDKGIDTAIDAVRSVNRAKGKTVFTLDIYGQVADSEKAWFDSVKTKLGDGVCSYKGAVKADSSAEVLKDYFALLFPTRNFTEGLPGTVVDAYCAGLPVISAAWQSCEDIICDGKSGFCYDFGNIRQLEDILLRLADNPEDVYGKKEYCLKLAEKYISQHVIKELIKLI